MASSQEPVISHPKENLPTEAPEATEKKATGEGELGRAPPLSKDRQAAGATPLKLDEVDMPALGPGAPALTAPRVSSQEEAHARAVAAGIAPGAEKAKTGTAAAAPTGEGAGPGSAEKVAAEAEVPKPLVGEEAEAAARKAPESGGAMPAVAPEEEVGKDKETGVAAKEEKKAAK